MGVAVTAAAPMIWAQVGSDAPSAPPPAASRPLALTPTEGLAGTTFTASFPCTGLATLAVTTEAQPTSLVFSDERADNTGDAVFTVPVPADQPPGVLRAVGVCARQGSGYGGYDGYDGYDGYNGCEGYGGYQGYEGYDGYGGYNCAVVTHGPAFFTVTELPDPPATPKLSVADVTVNELDRKSVRAEFVVSLSKPLPQNLRVKYRTVDGTANDGKPKSEDKDYAARDSSVLIKAGETSRVVDVSVVGDADPEATEKFTLELYDVDGVEVSDAVGEATIVDNEDAVNIRVFDASTIEGDRGKHQVEVTVRLSRASDATVRVKYRTIDGIAQDGKSPGEDKDYVGENGTISFGPGQTERTIRISVLGDTRDEITEQFNVTLSEPVNGSIFDNSAVVRIADDD